MPATSVLGGGQSLTSPPPTRLELLIKGLRGLASSFPYTQGYHFHA